MGGEVDHYQHQRCSAFVPEIESVVVSDHESLSVTFASCHENETWRSDAYAHVNYAVCHENVIVSFHKSENEIAFSHENESGVYVLLN